MLENTKAVAEVRAIVEAAHRAPCYCDDCEAGRIEDEREARAEEREAHRVRMAWHDAHPGHMHPPIWR